MPAETVPPDGAAPGGPPPGTDPEMAPAFTFRPAGEGHDTLLHRWLVAEHVQRWWGDPDQELALFRHGTPCLVIDPEETNIAARRAYEKAGFRAFDSYAEDGKTAILMQMTPTDLVTGAS